MYFIFMNFGTALFFFMPKTAYEMRIRDWSSDVCSSVLQRRYASEVTSDRSTVDRLTGTIVRQVGDLRRIVDEFSSFARMPKPVFRSEVIADIARHSLF